MQHVHYDVEKIVGDMRVEFSKIGEKGHHDHDAQQRHREVTVTLARLFLEETNRGEDADFILWLVASYVSEFIDNLQAFVEADVPVLAEIFTTHLISNIAQSTAGTSEVGATISFASTPGGRA